MPPASAALLADTGGQLGLQQLGEVRAAAASSRGVTVVLAPAEGAQQAVALAMTAKGRPEKVQSGRTQPVPPARKEPGEWKKARTPPRGRAAKYQEQVTGHSSQEGYRVGEVEFDGYIPDDSTLVQCGKGGPRWLKPAIC